MKPKAISNKAMQGAQRFGAAMFTPVMLLAFCGIMIGLTTLFTSSTIWGEWAGDESNLSYQVWTFLSNGAWAIFKQMPLIFVVALPIGLAKKQHARCCLEAILLYFTFHYFISSILLFWGPAFGVDFQSVVSVTGGIDDDPRFTSVAGIPTLDMGIAGSLFISAIVVFMHNRLFDKKLPVWLSAFNGAAAVCAIGFFVMIACAFLAVIVWPIIQNGIATLSTTLTNSKEIGVLGYTFLEKALLPFGLHHLIYFPVMYGDVLVQGGTYAQWLQDLPTIAASTDTLREVAPYAGFQMTALSSFFGTPGMAMAFYFTAKKENRKRLLAYLIPLVATAMFCGITEPIEFTFLFVAPGLFACHAVLGAVLTTTAFTLGITGSLAGNFFEQLAMNFIPCWPNHWTQYIIYFALGICFTFIYFFVFRFFIKKLNLPTPGRQDGAITFNTKSDYKEKKARKDNLENKILKLIGGSDNIVNVTNCATRLRVDVIDPSKVGEDKDFKAIGTHGCAKSGKNVQVIIGLEVAKVRENFEALL